MRVGGVTLGGLWTLVALRFLFGAGEAGAYPNITRALHNWFPREQWETAQGFVWMSGRLAGGLTPFLWAILVAGTSFSAPLVPWRGAFFVFGTVGLVWCGIFGVMFRNHPEDHPSVNAAERTLIGSQPSASDHIAGVPWGKLLTNRSLWVLCAMYALINFGWAFNFTYLPGYLKLRYNIPDGDLWGAIGKGAPLWVGAFGCVAGGLSVQHLATMTGNRQQARRIVGVFALSLSAFA
jgi:MFS family permease